MRTSAETSPVGAEIKRTLTITYEPDDERAFEKTAARFEKAWETGEYQGEFRSFASLPHLFTVFTANRCEIVSKLQQIGPSSLRGLARSLGRDVKRVHGDVSALIEEGIVERGANNKLSVPYAEISLRAELVTKAA